MVGKHDLASVGAVLITAFTAVTLLALLGPLIGFGEWAKITEETITERDSSSETAI